MLTLATLIHNSHPPGHLLAIYYLLRGSAEEPMPGTWMLFYPVLWKEQETFAAQFAWEHEDDGTLRREGSAQRLLQLASPVAPIPFSLDRF